MHARFALHAALMLAAPVATACSISVTHYLYVNVVRLEGPEVAGLRWIRVYNILDYEGDQRVLVSGQREGRRYPLAKWENGQECSYDEAGAERCEPNGPFRGINLEGRFGDWTAASDRRDDLKKLFLPIVVEIGGREIQMTLRSWPVRNNRELQSELHAKIAIPACDYINGVE